MNTILELSTLQRLITEASLTKAQEVMDRVLGCDLAKIEARVAAARGARFGGLWFPRGGGHV